MEVAIAFRNFKLAGKTETPSRRTQSVFEGLDWKIHLMTVLVQWFQHTTKWIASPLEKLHVLHYENLVNNPKEGEILDFN